MTLSEQHSRTNLLEDEVKNDGGPLLTPVPSTICAVCTCWNTTWPQIWNDEGLKLHFDTGTLFKKGSQCWWFCLNNNHHVCLYPQACSPLGSTRDLPCHLFCLWINDDFMDRISKQRRRAGEFLVWGAEEIVSLLFAESGSSWLHRPLTSTTLGQFEFIVLCWKTVNC